MYDFSAEIVALKKQPWVADKIKASAAEIFTFFYRFAA